MKIRVINNSIRLFFSKKDVERVKIEHEIEHDVAVCPQGGSGMRYGLELVEGDNDGAVFSGSKLKFYLSKKRLISWFESDGNSWSQLLPVGLGANLHLTLEKIDEEKAKNFKPESHCISLY